MAIRIMKQNNKRVRFCEQNDVKEVNAVDDVERELLWYTSNDLRQIRSEVQKQETLGSSSHTYRKQFIKSLLEQQTEHKMMGMADPKGLFQLSRTFTKNSRQMALKVGRDHEKEVREFSSKVETQQLVNILEEALDLLEGDL